ncbi:MAG: hypothetical protein JF616_15460 [Fibrobacteres bacterium]|nr:hypothetical protein [Fibrobacterota bacterium]
MIPIRARLFLAFSACVWISGCNLTDRPGLSNEPADHPDDSTAPPTSGGPRPNHAPTLGLGVHDLSMLEGESKVVVLRARDEDGDPLTFSIPDLDSLRALFPDGDRAISVVSGGDSLKIAFSPGSRKGNYRFRIVVADTAGGIEEQILTISVGHVNRPPAVSFASPATGTAFRVREGATLKFTVAVSDPDGDPTSLLSLDNPPWPRCGQGSYDTRSGQVTFSPSFQCVAAGETTFADLVFRAQDGGAPAETGQISARITVIDSNSAPQWKTATTSLTGKEGLPIVLDLKPLFAGDGEGDAVSFSSACGSIDSGSLRWTFVPGFRDAGHRECAVTASDSHHPPATAALDVVLDIADSVRKVDVAILSPISGSLVKDSVVKVDWMVGDQKQTDQTSERLLNEGPNVIRRSFRDSLGNSGADSVTVIRDTQGPLPPVISVPGLLNVAYPRWTWHGGGGGDGHFRVRLDKTDPAATMVDWGDTAYVPSHPLAEGSHTLYVQERDAAGNWSALASAAVTLDLTAPVVKIISPATGSWTNSSLIGVQWTVDGVPQVLQILEALPADGPVRITRSSVDAAGNRGADSVLVIRRTAAGAAPILTGTPSPTRAPVWTWTSGGPGGTGTFRLGWSDGIWFATVTTKKYAAAADITEGTQTLFVSESDSAGNWSAAASLAIVVDRTPPVLAISGPAPVAAITSADPALSGTLDEANGPVTVKWSGPGLTAGQAQVSGPAWNLPPLTYPAGDVTVTLTPTDAAGNTGAPAAITIHKRPGIVFVRSGQAGKGTSWQDAYGEVWQAVSGAAAAGGKEIWVSDGQYAVSQDGTGSLDIPSGLAVYGGFPADGTGLTTADRTVADPKSILVSTGTGFAVRMAGNGSTLDGFSIVAADGGLQGDSGNAGSNLLLSAPGGAYPIQIVTGDNGKTFQLKQVRVDGAKQALMAALTVGSKAKVDLVDCAFTGNFASDSGGGGGIWLDTQAKLTATGLTLSGNTVPDTAGALPRQMRVENKATADVKGTVEGDGDGIYVAQGGKAKLNGDDVPPQPAPDKKGKNDSGIVIAVP